MVTFALDKIAHRSCALTVRLRLRVRDYSEREDQKLNSTLIDIKILLRAAPETKLTLGSRT